MPAARRERPRACLAVLCSGQGTNLQAIINATRSGHIPARVGLVVSDRADALALVRAKRAGIPAIFVDPKHFPDRAAFERRLIERIDQAGAKLICLAGFMRLLSRVFVRRFPHRILNIHPALLPAFPGGQAVRDTLAWGAKVTGVTVHLVDEEVDHGPIVLQEALVIRPGETASHLLSRLHHVEHRLYPVAIRLILTGKVRVEGRAVIVVPRARVRI